MKNRLVITLVLVGLLAFGVGMGTFAWFTSEATSTGNVFKTGTLKIDSPGKITANMTVDNIYPSWTSGETTITVHNSGSLDFKYRIKEVNSKKDSILYNGANCIQVKINDENYVPINELKNFDLGQIESNGDGQFTIQFRLPEGANNDYQGKSETFEFVFEATQTGNDSWSQ